MEKDKDLEWEGENFWSDSNLSHSKRQIDDDIIDARSKLSAEIENHEHQVAESSFDGVWWQTHVSMKTSTIDGNYVILPTNNIAYLNRSNNIE